LKTPKKVLIIEDEKPLARALELKLTHAGFQTKVVFNGEYAMQIISKEPFALILLDLIMPKMDGFTLLAMLKIKK
jgi:DNA-binding response OmpR family regulator